MSQKYPKPERIDSFMLIMILVLVIAESFVLGVDVSSRHWTQALIDGILIVWWIGLLVFVYFNSLLNVEISVMEHFLTRLENMRKKIEKENISKELKKENKNAKLKK